MKAIAIPQTSRDFWEGTTSIRCPCGGMIEWAEAAYSPGIRACRSCLAMYAVRGQGSDRRLVPQTHTDTGVIGDPPGDECPDDDVYRVPENLYPGWYEPARSGNA